MLIVSDSNGSRLKLQQLKPEARVIKETRYTTVEATEKIPLIDDPSEVADIVFQVGFNDYRNGTTPEKIQEKYLNMQIMYFQKFSEARQHIMAIPPIGKTHNEVNELFQQLSKFTEANFITTKALRDNRTGRIRPNLMDGIHYNDYGIKLVAREIKKSLYSTANRENQKLRMLADSMLNEQPSEPVNSDMEIDDAVEPMVNNALGTNALTINAQVNNAQVTDAPSN